MCNFKQHEYCQFLPLPRYVHQISSVLRGRNSSWKNVKLKKKEKKEKKRKRKEKKKNGKKVVILYLPPRMWIFFFVSELRKGFVMLNKIGNTDAAGKKERKRTQFNNFESVEQRKVIYFFNY